MDGIWYARVIFWMVGRMLVRPGLPVVSRNVWNAIAASVFRSMHRLEKLYINVYDVVVDL